MDRTGQKSLVWLKSFVSSLIAIILCLLNKLLLLLLASSSSSLRCTYIGRVGNIAWLTLVPTYRIHALLPTHHIAQVYVQWQHGMEEYNQIGVQKLFLGQPGHVRGL